MIKIIELENAKLAIRFISFLRGLLHYMVWYELLSKQKRKKRQNERQKTCLKHSSFRPKRLKPGRNNNERCNGHKFYRKKCPRKLQCRKGHYRN